MKITQFLAASTLALNLIPSFSLTAQAVKIHEGLAIQSGICEPSISVDPTQPSNVYAASILNNFYQSTDGGATWEKSTIKSPYGVWGDPCLITDNQGMLYYFHLSDPEGTNWKSDSIIDRIVCQTKSGIDAAFNEGSFTKVNGKKHDKEWAAVHPTQGTIGLSWTQFDAYGIADSSCKSTILFSESHDQGSSWTEPVVITERTGNCVDDDQTAEGAVPSYGINTARYIVWALDNVIYFSRSLDGTTWEEITVAPQQAGWSQSYDGFARANGMPVSAVDHCKESPFYGRIYLGWGDQNDVDGGEIFMAFSDDAGAHWSTPSKVSPNGGASDQFLPWITVDPTSGFIYAVYYDRRNTQKPTETNTYLAVSKDGGESWSEQQINESPFYPSDAVFMGDYNHISAHSGVVRPIWTELSGVKKSVWTYLYNEH